jgi:hypothetical protein
MRRRGRTDSNHTAIVAALRRAGATVQSLADVGAGCPDLLVGWRGGTFLVEVKDGAKSPSHRTLTEMEQRWHDGWKGMRVVIMESVDDVVAFIERPWKP